MSDSPMIEFRNIAKQFDGYTVVRGLDLSIARGEFCVLIGASGSGKSTILRMINRLLEHSEGEIRFAGEEIRSFAPEILRRRIGYAIQSVGLFPHWTVERNIATVPRLLKWDRGRIERRVSELLGLLGLDEARLRGSYPHQLSGGQQQRVGVARALAADPDVLLMDEPFGALDPVTRESLQVEIARIHRETGKTIVFVTHDMDEALRLATRIVILGGGGIVQAATPRELLANPASDDVRSFIGKADYGLKLLALTPVRERMRTLDDTELAGLQALPCISAADDLRAAMSRLVMERTDRLGVTDADGTMVGILHLADLTR
jgi:osmoprotectant transport system ATP-binding protein